MKTSTCNPRAQRVTDGRLLQRMADAGHISQPGPSHRPAGLSWGSGYAYVDADLKSFHFEGRFYRIAYVDGCFLPFVFDLGPIS